MSSCWYDWENNGPVDMTWLHSKTSSLWANQDSSHSVFKFRLKISECLLSRYIYWKLKYIWTTDVLKSSNSQRHDSMSFILAVIMWPAQWHHGFSQHTIFPQTQVWPCYQYRHCLTVTKWKNCIYGDCSHWVMEQQQHSLQQVHQGLQQDGNDPESGPCLFNHQVFKLNHCSHHCMWGGCPLPGLWFLYWVCSSILVWEESGPCSQSR